jgi:hypothetical protein
MTRSKKSPFQLIKGDSMNIMTNLKRFGLAALAATTIGSLAFGSANALASASSGDASAKAAAATAAQQQRLGNIISKGNQEISRRLIVLGKLPAIVNSAKELPTNTTYAQNKASLLSEISTQVSNLTTLKTTLDGETTVSAAATDVGNMYTEYRVYALVVPQVAIFKHADDEQATAAKLTAMETGLQSRITADTGSNQATLQSDLNDLKAKVVLAQGIAGPLEDKVVAFVPGDYDADHTILSGDATSLKTAHADNVVAATDAKNIITALKS